jgi:hypothetical protein
MLTVLGLLIAAVPIVFVVVLFNVVGATQRRRAAVIARQIHLTDRLHARLGALVAPVVDKPLGRPWRVSVSMPLERTDAVSVLLDVVADDFASTNPRRPEPFQLVLSPRETPVAVASRPTAAPRRQESMSWT